MDKFHCGKILLHVARQIVDEGLCGLDLDPNQPLEDGEDFGRDGANIDIGIVEPDDLPEAAELDLSKVARAAVRRVREAADAGRRTKVVLVTGDGPAPVPAGTRVLHLHDRSYMWRFAIGLYVQTKDGAKRARANRRALKAWKPKSKARRPEVARLLRLLAGEA